MKRSELVDVAEGLRAISVAIMADFDDDEGDMPTTREAFALALRSSAMTLESLN